MEARLGETTITNVLELSPGLSSSRRSSRLIALALTSLLAAVTAMPQVAAAEIVNCTLVDEDGAPWSGEVVVITNDNTHDQTTVTTDSNGNCSTDAGGLNLQVGQVVTLTHVVALSLSNCQVIAPMKVTTKFVAADQLVLVASRTIPALIPTTLSVGKVSSSRTAANVVTRTVDIPFARVQGDGGPWGHFNIEGVFRLKDNFALPPFPITDSRVYDFVWTVMYKGYLDANCAVNQVPGIPADLADDLHATFANANLPYDSGDTTITKALNAGQLPLDAQKVGQGANDKLMMIEVETQIFECDGTANWGNCQNAGGGGPLLLDVTSSYFVEP